MTARAQNRAGLMRRTAAACLALGLFAPAAATAQTTASFQVSAAIVPGCEVNGATPAAGASVGQIGTLDFGTHSALATGQVTATMVRSAGFTLACTPSVALAMTLDGGLHAAGGRNLQAQGGPERIAYRLYSDAAFSQELLTGQAVPLAFSTPSSVALPVYARLTLPGNARPAVYSDTVVVTLAW